MTHVDDCDDSIVNQEEEDLHQLSLTKNEALFIDDMLSLMVMISEDKGQTSTSVLTTLRPLAPRAGLPATSNFIQKIAHAVLFETDPDNDGQDAVVYLDNSELYMLRDIALTTYVCGEEPVGYNLKRKIYGALFGATYSRDKIAGQLLSQIDPVALELVSSEPLQEEPSSNPSGGQDTGDT